MNVLLVDDHPIILSLYESVLTEYFSITNNIKISKAHNCEQAYNAIVNNEDRLIYDLAIVDYSLPAYSTKNVTNGSDIARLLKQYCNSCKVIIITAHSEMLRVYDIFRKTRPEAMIIKNDLTTGDLPVIVSTVMEGNYYQSPTVKTSTSEIWKKQILAEEENRKIIFYLSKGYKIKDLEGVINLSASSIQRRASNIKKAFGISDEASLVSELIKRGFI